jgi:hypothetical protein
MSDLSKLVKPLVWARGIVDYAKPMPGMKYVACSTTPHGCWSWWLDDAHSSTRTDERDEAHAKAAAQADYTARIIAALDPEALAKIRADALREAAERAQNRWAIRKEHAAALYEMDYPEALIDSKTVSAKGDEAESIANEILAMIDKEDQA